MSLFETGVLIFFKLSKYDIIQWKMNLNTILQISVTVKLHGYHLNIKISKLWKNEISWFNVTKSVSRVRCIIKSFSSFQGLIEPIPQRKFLSGNMPEFISTFMTYVNTKTLSGIIPLFYGSTIYQHCNQKYTVLQ